MSEIRVKDIIFSFRHLYLENQKKVNKRLRKHITIKNHLISDISLYLKADSYSDGDINVKYRFNKGSLGSLLSNISNKYYLNNGLTEDPILKKKDGKYETDSKCIGIKDDRLDREVECLLKEDFFSSISSTFVNGNASISFTGYDITFSSDKFVICYNAVGDLIYSYSYHAMDINEILDTVIDTEIDSEYHNCFIERIRKTVEPVTPELNENFPGNYFIKETNSEYTLKKVKKNQLPRYI